LRRAAGALSAAPPSPPPPTTVWKRDAEGFVSPPPGRPSGSVPPTRFRSVWPLYGDRVLSDEELEALIRAYPDGGWGCDNCHTYGAGTPESEDCPVCGEPLVIWKRKDVAAVKSYAGPFDRFVDGPLLEVPERTGKAISMLFVAAIFTFLITLPIISLDLLNGIYSVATSPVAIIWYMSGVYAAFVYPLVHTGLIQTKSKKKDGNQDSAQDEHDQEQDQWNSKYT